MTADKRAGNGQPMTAQERPSFRRVSGLLRNRRSRLSSGLALSDSLSNLSLTFNHLGEDCFLVVAFVAFIAYI